MAEVSASISPGITLSECVDRYLLARRISTKKYYPAYLADAINVWKDIFQKTLQVMASKWQPTVEDSPYYYVDLPKCAVRIFSFNVTDECGNLVELFYDAQKNIIPVPTKSTTYCDCQSCSCDGTLCESVNSTTMTTKKIFTINGKDYYEKKWIRYCDDGCVIEYTKTPVKKYKDTKGMQGDFNDDFNGDYFRGHPGFENFEIVYVDSQERVCQLETKPCGCPADTEENKSLIQNSCGCYINPCVKKKCFPIYQNINNNGYGSIKISDCGTRAYFMPGNKCKSTPDFINISYQVSGETPGAEVIVPEWAEECMYYGIDYFSMRFNRAYSRFEKEGAKQLYENEQIELIKYLYPISLSFLSKVQDAKILW